jgi:hypothetical protein
MATALPTPEVLECYFDDHFEPRLPAMRLRWPVEGQESDQIWRLPAGTRLTGPAPERFGLTITRRGADSYELRVLWNSSALSWASLNRNDILRSALRSLLAAMGTDLWYLLDQPLPDRISPPPRVA